jgi:hypothetical protein
MVPKMVKYRYMPDKFPPVGELPGPESESGANRRRGVK